MMQPGPMRTAPSITTNGPTSTSSANSASGETTAVGWIRTDGASGMAAPVAGANGENLAKPGEPGAQPARQACGWNMYTAFPTSEASPVLRAAVDAEKSGAI